MYDTPSTIHDEDSYLHHCLNTYDCNETETRQYPRILKRRLNYVIVRSSVIGKVISNPKSATEFLRSSKKWMDDSWARLQTRIEPNIDSTKSMAFVCVSINGWFKYISTCV